MNLIYYKDKIEKLGLIYNKNKSKYNVITYLVFSIFLISLVLFFMFDFEEGSTKQTISIIGLVILFLLYIFCLIFSYMNSQKFLKTQVQKLIFDIFNFESDDNLKQSFDYKNLRQLIKNTHFTRPYDNISISNSFEFNISGQKGFYIRTNITRSVGKTSIAIFNGDVILLNIPNDFECQFRNDRFSMFEGIKINDENFIERVFVSKFSKTSVIPQETISKYKQIKSLYQTYPNGVCFMRNSLAVFVKSMHDIKNPQVLDINSFEYIMNVYDSIIKETKELIEILE